jgi:ParB family chromosome partitioning protein
MPDIRLVPLAEIDAGALTRDRTGLDAEALAELRHSILAHGLRLPVELFPFSAERSRTDGCRYGLISGYRRLVVYAERAEAGDAAFAAIPALVREGVDAAEAFRAMVEENAVRAPLSPWEAGRAVWQAALNGFHPTIEAAANALHPGATRQKRARLRAIARLVEELDDLLTAPERLTQNQLLRLAEAWNAGFDGAIRAAVEATDGAPPDRQWAALAPLLDEDAEKRRHPPERSPGPGRPRRVLKPRPGLTIRRERTRDGYVLRCSGREATSALMDEVFDRIEQIFTPADTAR